MRIGIDGFNLALPHGTGVATYGFGLAEAIQGLGHQLDGIFGLDVGSDPKLREIRFFDALGRNTPLRGKRLMVQRVLEFPRNFGTVRLRDVPWSDQVVKKAFARRLPTFDRLLSAGRLFERAERHFQLTGRFLKVEMPSPPEVMHWTYPLPVRLEGARNVYTLHDLVPLKLPYTTLDIKRTYFRLVQHIVAHADHILTVSESSRRDIEDMFGPARGGISNCYQSAPVPLDLDPDAAAEDAAAIEGIFGLKAQGYFLYFGAIEPKKNLGRLIEAYLAMRTDTPLVIVGARSWQSEEELKLIKGGSHLSGRIVQLDYLPRTLLMRLIRCAKAVAFPSLYEGFGLPVLEAMQMGTPVLTGDTSSLPEVAGAAAVKVDPYDVAAISAGLSRLDADADLRNALRKAGHEQAARFSPSAYQDRLARVYAEVAGRATG